MMPVPFERQCQVSPLDLQPQIQDTLGVLDNLVASKLGLAVQSVHEADRDLCHGATHRLCSHHHLHLEGVALALRLPDDLLQHLLFVQPEATGQIAHARPQHGIREQIRPPADELALEVPAVNAAIAGVARAGHNVVVTLLLHADHVRDELGVVTEVGVHDDDEVARRELQAVDVGGAETQLAGAGADLDVRGVDFGELSGDFLGAVG